MSNNNRVCIGVITGVHGIKGHVKLKSFTSNPEDIMTYGVLEDESGLKKIDVKIIGEGKDFFRAAIKGVSNRNEAETFRGLKLYVDREKMPETEEDEFYHTDLIGLDVFCENELIGQVSAIYDFGAGDLLEVSNSDNRQMMVSFTKENVPVVDIANKKIIINRIIEIEAENQEELKI